MAIKTPEEALEEVKKQLQIAIELEHATIPPYLYAYWSVKDPESHIARAIIDVVKEEMLHMILACNILNSLGGEPLINEKNFIPDYPAALPGHHICRDPLIVSLRKLDFEAIVSFLHIELPQDLATGHYNRPLRKEQVYDSIGEFYDAIWTNLKLLTDDMYQKRRQVPPEFAPYKSGELFEVCCREDAYNAIKLIIEQGEGINFDPDLHGDDEPHFQRFFNIYAEMGGKGEIAQGSFNTKDLKENVDDEAYELFKKSIRNVTSDPKQNNSSEKSAQFYNKKFNSLYSRMLDRMHEQINSDHPNLYPSIELMFLMTRPALELMSIPVDVNDPDKGFCGPTFDYLPFEERI